ncbi:MAG: hypothetical protein WD511_00080, partial [Balneolaceae bacterium]
SRSNPGFQYEVVLETNFRVAVYDWEGGSPTKVWESTNLDDYFQKAISYEHYGQNGNSGENGYFYDFYVPLNAVSGNFSTDLGDDFRVAVSTITNARRGISGVISDILGSNGLDPVSECVGGINSMFCDEVDPTTNVPTITTPIYAGANTIRGRLSEEAGVEITVYVEDAETEIVSTYTTNVDAEFNWEVVLPEELEVNGKISAEAKDPNKKRSSRSAEVTVYSEDTVEPCQDGKTNTPTNVERQEAGGSGNYKGIEGNAESGATVFLYNSDFTLIESVNADDGTWEVSPNEPTGFTYINAQVGTKCASDYVTLDGTTEVVNKTDIPTFASTPDIGDTSVEVKNEDDSPAILYLFFESDTLQTDSEIPSGETHEFTDAPVFSENDVIRARAKNSTDGISDKVELIVSSSPEPPAPDTSAAPEITGDYVAGSNVTVEGFSIEEAGATIYLYDENDNIIGSTEVKIDNTWEITGVNLTSISSLKATAKAPGEEESEFSEVVEVLDAAPNAPTLNGSLSIFSNSLNVSGVGADGYISIYVDEGAVAFFDVADGDETNISGGSGYLYYESSLDTEVQISDSDFIQNELYKGAKVYVTYTPEGQIESDSSNHVMVTGIEDLLITEESGVDENGDFDSIPTQVAGELFDIYIQARDQNGDKFENFTDNVLLYSVEAPITNDKRETNDFTEGDIVHSTQFDDGAEDVIIRALYIDNPEITGASNAFLVNNPN